MISEIIQSRLSEYQFESPEDEWSAIREIVQELALAALSQAGFFKYAAFHGGTCLRIIHQLPRFSEDLDFALLHEDSQFEWRRYMASMTKEFHAFGLNVQIQDRSTLMSNVKKVFIKQDSVGQILTFQFPRDRSQSQTIRIKLEVDTKPPQGATCETKMVDFPYPCPVTVHDMSSLFAGKCLALLCRNYTKGRDYFDLLWYLRRRTKINLSLLQNGLEQNGFLQKNDIQIDEEWVVENLKRRVRATDFSLAIADVRKFLKPVEARGLASWDSGYFSEQIERCFS